eukprot:CAMPEP_0117866192 /NCGR_PEP_ID=MMETSP0950-20121206/7203_1 /TAXON_ID=44440 /ORGANISM="Chattonella subsalsa, Strain CCMP2191" /LENGTH=660 /DNA_ID=CAMNT_0005717451 /DNA_START=278 /DNA_END=2256 /DNA_ORIENTATION=+
MQATDELCQLLVLIITSPNLELQSNVAVNMVMQVLSFIKAQADTATRPDSVKGLLSARALQLTHDLNPQLILENPLLTLENVNRQTSASIAVSQAMKPMAQANNAQEVFDSLAEVLAKLEISEAVDPDSVCIDLFEGHIVGSLAGWSLKSESEYQREVQNKVKQITVQERSRVDVSALAEDASLGRVERHWRKLIRLTEAELGLRGADALSPSTGLDGGGRSKEALGGSVLGRPQYKLAGGAHEGPILARRRPIIKLQAGHVAELQTNNQSLLYLTRNSSVEDHLPESVKLQLERSKSAEEMLESNMKLAKQCSKYFKDLPLESEPEIASEDEKKEDANSGGLLRDWGVVSDDTPQGTPDLTNEVDIDEDDDESKSGNELDKKYNLNLADGKFHVQDLGPGLGPGLDPKANVLLEGDNTILVLPKGNQCGKVFLTKKFIHFKPMNPEDEDGMQEIDDGVIDLVGAGALQKQKNRRWLIHWINGIYLRRYRLRNTALEVFFRNGKSRSFFLDFGSKQDSNERRDHFVRTLISLAPTRALKEHPESSTRSLLRMHSATLRWQRREISNFDYLMALNTLAGRAGRSTTFANTPVFPWILSNYIEEEIDLSDESNYRDLRKPMGAINPERLQEFLDRFHSLQGESGLIRPFMYGSHYSTAMGVV